MTRINTNVSSLVAQNTLGRSNASLNQALTRLSTGLRINTGKDDPAGLIASENLRSDITSIQRAISNTDRANQVIATADSALGQVSSLLNDIRGLVTESANDGALSPEQLAANQLQVDSSLEALNRIAQTTTFQGRRLLDGSLDFLTTAGSNFTKLSDLKIDQANLGATGSVTVDVEVTTAATKAEVNITNIPAAVTGVNSVGSITFDDAAVPSTGTIQFATTAKQATGTLTVASEANGTLTIDGGVINLQALHGGTATGAEGDQPAVLNVTFGAGAAASTYTAATNTLNVSVTQADGAATVADIAAAIGVGTDFTATVASGGATAITAAEAAAGAFALSGGNDTITLTALSGGNAAGAEGNQVANLAITFGAGAAATSYVAATNTLNVSVTQASGTATLANIIAAIDGGTDFDAAIGTSNGTATVHSGDVAGAAFALAGGSTAATQTITITGTNGAASNVDITVVEAAGIGATPTVVGDATNGYTVRVDSGSQNTTLADIATAIQSIAEVATAVASTPAAIYNGTSDTALGGAGVSTSLTGGDDAGSDIIEIIGNTSGNNNRALAFVDTANLGDGVISVTDDGTTITINLDDTSSYDLQEIVDAINEDIGEDFTATLIQNDVDGEYDAATDTAPAGADLVGPTGGVAASGGLTAAVVLELAGINGSEVVSFGAGTSIADLVAGINLLSDATGVEASIGAVSTTLVLESSAYGSAGVVDLKVISEGSGSTPSGLFTSAVGSGTRATGTDVAATINGVVATGDGNQITINTATLDLSTTLEAGFTGTASFTITGGGALFQLGPDVVSNQQARLGIGSVNTARLGGVSGKLFQLGTGGTASLSSDNLDTAASIVEEAINQVTSLRGRLGAFQRTTLETNKQALGDTLVNLTDAESSIRDADFASETAALTRAQILVQSGTTVLQIANSNPQNVLALLRG
jgi:flagellin